MSGYYILFRMYKSRMYTISQQQSKGGEEPSAAKRGLPEGKRSCSDSESGAIS